MPQLEEYISDSLAESLKHVVWKFCINQRNRHTFSDVSLETIVNNEVLRKNKDLMVLGIIHKVIKEEQR